MPPGTRAIMKKFILVCDFVMELFVFVIVIVYQPNMNKV